MRDFLNSILAFIGLESLTDDEFETLEIESYGYDNDTYLALSDILKSRESVSTAQDALRHYFLAKGAELETVSVGRSNIFIGAALDCDDPIPSYPGSSASTALADDYATEGKQDAIIAILESTNEALDDIFAKVLSFETDSIQVHGDVGVLSQFNLSNSNPLTVAIVDADGNQITSLGGGGSSGTEYTEGDVETEIVGTAIMWEDDSDVMRAVSAAKPLPVGVIGSIVVEASSLDIRPLDFATDSVDVSGSSIEVSNFPSTQEVTGTIELGATSLAALENISVTVTSIGEVEIRNESGNPVPISGDVVVVSSALPSDAATQTTLEALNNKVTAVDTGAVVVTTLPSLPSGTNNIGDVDVLSLPAITGTVAVSNFPATQPVSGTVTANAGTNLNTSALSLETTQNSLKTALEIMDDWDESDRAKVNIVVGQAGVTAGAGSVAANTPRITHASDDPVTTALQIMDDWDESDRAKVNIIVGQAGVQGASGAVSANTQRVVLATDVALPTGTNTLGSIKITDGTTVVTVRELGSNDAINVAICDGSGNQITSFGGGTQYTEDVASAADPIGTMLMAVRADTLSAVTTTDGDNIASRATNKGELYVKHVDTIQAVGSIAHDTTDSGNPVKIGFVAKNLGSLITPVTDGDRVNGLADRYGSQFVIQGSSFIKTLNVDFSSAQAGTAIITAASNESIRIYSYIVQIDYDAQVAASIYMGFGAVSTPLTAGCLFANTGIVPGYYPMTYSAPPQGASGEDLRITSDAPVNGNISIQVVYDIVVI